MKAENSVLWQQTLKVLKALGAPEPLYSDAMSYRIATFYKGGWHSESVNIAIQLGAGHVGVVATDLFRAGIITLSEEAANVGGVHNLPLDSFIPEIIERLKGDKTYPHERFGI